MWPARGSALRSLDMAGLSAEGLGTAVLGGTRSEHPFSDHSHRPLLSNDPFWCTRSPGLARALEPTQNSAGGGGAASRDGFRLRDFSWAHSTLSQPWLGRTVHERRNYPLNECSLCSFGRTRGRARRGPPRSSVFLCAVGYVERTSRGEAAPCHTKTLASASAPALAM